MLVPEPLDRLFERLHARVREHVVLQLEAVRRADEVPCRVRTEKDFECGDAAPSRRAEELLGDDALEAVRELVADFFLAVARKILDEAVDGFDNRAGVERREYEMPRLCGGQSRLYGFRVAHLAYEDDVRILSEDIAEPFEEGRAVAPSKRW